MVLIYFNNQMIRSAPGEEIIPLFIITVGPKLKTRQTSPFSKTFLDFK